MSNKFLIRLYRIEKIKFIIYKDKYKLNFTNVKKNVFYLKLIEPNFGKLIFYWILKFDRIIIFSSY